MQEQNDNLNSADLEFEQALRSIPPAPAHLNPTTAAFLAGRRSTRRRLHLWQSAAAIFLLLGIGSHLLPSSPTPRTIPSTPAVYSSPLPLPNHSLLMLEAAVQKNGLAGLTPTSLPRLATPRAGRV